MARIYLPQLVLLTGLCVLSIFFFPAVQGPYPAVHGPTTALQSLQNSNRALFGLVIAACFIFGNLSGVLSHRLPFPPVRWITELFGGLAGASAVLRC